MKKAARQPQHCQAWEREQRVAGRDPGELSVFTAGGTYRRNRAGRRGTKKAARQHQDCQARCLAAGHRKGPCGAKCLHGRQQPQAKEAHHRRSGRQAGRQGGAGEGGRRRALVPSDSGACSCIHILVFSGFYCMDLLSSSGAQPGRLRASPMQTSEQARATKQRAPGARWMCSGCGARGGRQLSAEGGGGGARCRG